MIKRNRNPSSRLKHQLILEAAAGTPDGLGGHLYTWNEVATLWSEIIPIGGRESAFASQLTTNTRFRIVVRYRGDITPKMRLRDASDERIFNIRSVINVEEENQLVEILAERIQP